MPMHLTARFANMMKMSGDIYYNDMVGDYKVQYVCLKLCYKDTVEIINSFSKKDNEENRMVEQEPQPQ